jgi:hypothetical protein
MIATAPAVRLQPRSRTEAIKSGGRLLRLELRHSAMLAMLPLTAALFWFNAYRPSMAEPPLWSLRAPTMQHGALLDFLLPVVGAAAWMGAREHRRGVTDLAEIAARPRWIRQLYAWAAVTAWALVGYMICVGVLYAVTASEAPWGGPLWWPAVVGAAGLPALAAVGFAAGSCFPSRFMTPLISIGVFFLLGLSVNLTHGGASFWQISPIIAGAVDIGGDPGVATFYPYLPDLPIAQVMFLAGLTAAVLAALGWTVASGGRMLRATAAAICVAGLAAAATAVGLAGTARLDRHGMMVIPALHDAANDKPIRYDPVCSKGSLPVCLNPAFGGYLPLVASALRPVVSQVAGLPGAPDRILQAVPTFTQEPHDAILVGAGGVAGARYAPGLRVVGAALPDQLPGERQPDVTSAQYADQVRAQVGDAVVGYVLGTGRHDSLAQEAVRAGLLMVAGVRLVPPGQRPDGLSMSARGLAPGTAVYRSARQFAALPSATRRAWLSTHLIALRAGSITLAQLP